LIPWVIGFIILLCFVLDSYSRWSLRTVLIDLPIDFQSGASESIGLEGKYKPFFSMYRTSMMVSTCIAILAVDFPIFPRRFAKTETYGTSVMDMGVGSFLLSNALVYRQTQKKNFANLVLRIIPLLVLGFIRLLTVKGTDYQEHVTEYGVHWNFFFTLAIISLFAGMCNISETRGALYGLLLALGYQIVLGLGLRNYILNAPRSDLLAENKEGVLSSIGYFALFLIGTQVGHIVLVDRKAKRDGLNLVFSLALADGLLWITFFMMETYVEPTSRRLVNSTYILSTLSQNMMTLCLLLLVNLIVRQPARPWDGLIQAINRNQLFIFLLANLLVGLVNFSMKTLYTADLYAITVILLYMTLVCGVAAILHSHDITVKCW